MSPFVTSLVIASLAVLAGAGVVAGFLRRDPVPVEPVGDPLEDRRLALLRSLADLEDAHVSGALEDADYARLRRDTDARIAKLLRAVDRKERGRPAVALDPRGRVSSGEQDAVGVREPRRVPAWAVAVLIGGTVAAMVVAALVRDSSGVAGTSAQPVAATGSNDPLAFFRERVRQHPDDLAARLDLAHRYLDAGMVPEALDEYKAALALDPDDAEAHAHVGLILYLADRPEQALESVDRALDTDPDYPEALFIRGVILLRGLDRPQDAIDAFEQYLDAAPFGTERQAVPDLIDEARAALEGS